MEIQKIPALYVGLDDSNHAGQNIKYEINLATFSFLHEDSIVKVFPNRRNSFGGSEEWLKNPNRDFLFVILEAQKFRTS